MRVEKYCEYGGSASREGVRVESREGERMEKEKVEKECE